MGQVGAALKAVWMPVGFAMELGKLLMCKASAVRQLLTLLAPVVRYRYVYCTSACCLDLQVYQPERQVHTVFHHVIEPADCLCQTLCIANVWP